MPNSRPRLTRAWLDSLSSGIVEFERNWTAGERAAAGPGAGGARDLRALPGARGGRRKQLRVPAAGLGRVRLRPAARRSEKDIDPARDDVYLAGRLQRLAGGDRAEEWRLAPAELDGEQVLVWTGPAAGFHASPPPQFQVCHRRVLLAHAAGRRAEHRAGRARKHEPVHRPLPDGPAPLALRAGRSRSN